MLIIVFPQQHLIKLRYILHFTSRTVVGTSLERSPCFADVAVSVDRSPGRIKLRVWICRVDQAEKLKILIPVSGVKVVDVVGEGVIDLGCHVVSWTVEQRQLETIKLWSEASIISPASEVERKDAFSAHLCHCSARFWIEVEYWLLITNASIITVIISVIIITQIVLL